MKMETLKNKDIRHLRYLSLLDANPRLIYTSEWEKIPYEMREMIFKSMDGGPDELYLSWNGSMHSLITSLRDQPQAYEHVLEYFKKEHGDIFMNRWVGYTFSKMNKPEMDCITSVEIELSDICHTLASKPSGKKSKDGSTIYIAEKPEWFTEELRKLHNLTHVYLYLDLDNDVDEDDIVHFVTEWPFWLAGCTRLTHLTVEIPQVTSMVQDRTAFKAVIDGMMKRFQKKVGVMGQCTGQLGPPSDGEAEIWEWVAAPGKTMDWSQELGRIWQYPRNEYRVPVWSLLDGIGGRIEEVDGALVIEDYEAWYDQF